MDRKIVYFERTITERGKEESESRASDLESGKGAEEEGVVRGQAQESAVRTSGGGRVSRPSNAQEERAGPDGQTRHDRR